MKTIKQINLTQSRSNMKEPKDDKDISLIVLCTIYMIGILITLYFGDISVDAAFISFGLYIMCLFINQKNNHLNP